MSQYSLRSNTIYAILGGSAIGVFGLLRTFVVAHTLSPVEFGGWSLIQLVLVYAGFSHLGVGVAMPNDMVGQVALGQKEAAARTGAAGLWLMGATSAVASLVIFALPTSLVGPVFSTYKVWMVATLVSQQVLLYATALHRGYTDFKRIALSQTVFGSASILGMLILVPRWGIRGGLFSMLLANLGGAVVGGFPWRNLPIFQNYSRSSAFPLFLAGLPLWVSALVGTALQNVDRVVIGRSLGTIPLGTYSVGNIFVTPIMFLPAILGGLVMTHFARAAVIDTPSSARAQFLRFSLAVSMVLAVATAITFVVSAGVIQHYLPYYKAALPTFQLLIAGSYFYGASLLLANYLIGNKHQHLLLGVQAGAMALLALLCWGSLRLGWGLSGVGWANIASYGLYWACLLLAAGRAMGWPVAFQLQLAGSSFLPVAVMGVAILGTGFLGPLWQPRGIYSWPFVIHLAVILAVGLGMAYTGLLWHRRNPLQ